VLAVHGSEERRRHNAREEAAASSKGSQGWGLLAHGLAAALRASCPKGERERCLGPPSTQASGGGAPDLLPRGRAVAAPGAPDLHWRASLGARRGGPSPWWFPIGLSAVLTPRLPPCYARGRGPCRGGRRGGQRGSRGLSREGLLWWAGPYRVSTLLRRRIGDVSVSDTVSDTDT